MFCSVLPPRCMAQASLACVLTGMGRDGAKGAERVRAVGGRIIVQDEASSVVWGMPGAVVAAGVATDVVPLPQIADRLQGALGNRRVARPTPACVTASSRRLRRRPVTISASAFTFVSELVKRQAAIVIGPGKEYLVESRLLPLARDAGLDDVGALIARLQGSHDDVSASADRRGDDDQRDVVLPRPRPVQCALAGDRARTVQAASHEPSPDGVVGGMLDRSGAVQHRHDAAGPSFDHRRLAS